jgi:GTP-binding protein Era
MTRKTKKPGQDQEAAPDQRQHEDGARSTSADHETAGRSLPGDLNDEDLDDLQEDDEELVEDDGDGDEDGERAAPVGPTRCGFVALIGAPNAGKSTLLNALVGTKVSIVSRKVQTTRALVRGIALEGPAQIIFVDTPGIFAPKRRLDRAMVTSAWGGAGDADVIALLIDARKGVDEEAAAIIARLGELKQRKVLILTKVDVTDRPRLLKLAQDLNEKHAFAETFMVAALTGDGIDHVRRKFSEMMPLGPWLYPEDQVSDAPLRALAAEITREKLFERLHDELPYQITVETDQWQVRKDGSARVEQTIFVTRETHRMIVLGKGGQTIKAIGQASRKDIEEAADCKIHLFLFVKVRENWIDDPARYREMGLEFPKD